MVRTSALIAYYSHIADLPPRGIGLARIWLAHVLLLLDVHNTDGDLTTGDAVTSPAAGTTATQRPSDFGRSLFAPVFLSGQFPGLRGLACNGED